MATGNYNPHDDKYTIPDNAANELRVQQRDSAEAAIKEWFSFVVPAIHLNAIYRECMSLPAVQAYIHATEYFPNTRKYIVRTMIGRQISVILDNLLVADIRNSKQPDLSITLNTPENS
jgi:hypothetical protein